MFLTTALRTWTFVTRQTLLRLFTITLSICCTNLIIHEKRALEVGSTCISCKTHPENYCVRDVLTMNVKRNFAKSSIL